ncbi:MAG TPA: sigma factor-like helix-turn-helix DNA-binding protein, partial [Solirubrobacterales bacterium]
MALSEDQRALLRLLVAGDSYEQVAEVLGTSPHDVRRRAHEAANALEDEPNPGMPPEAVGPRLAALDGTGTPART